MYSSKWQCLREEFEQNGRMSGQTLADDLYRRKRGKEGVVETKAVAMIKITVKSKSITQCMCLTGALVEQ